MKFTVGDWMIDLLVYIHPDSTVKEALTLMRRRYIHSLIVEKSEDNLNYGILTSTDICDKIIAKDKNPNDVKVREIMSSPLITVDKGMPLKECAENMHKFHIHHIPVVNDNGDLVGMVSATDFLVAAEAMGNLPGEKIV
jgi:CBS domain-containing protein